MTVTERTSRPRSPLLRPRHETFAERLEVVGQVTGSAYKVTQKSGVAPSTLRNLADGGEPTRPTLAAIAEHCGFSVAWLVCGTGPMRPVPAVVRHAVATSYLRYCKGRQIEDGARAQQEFIQAYNAGVVVRSAEFPVIALYELQQWLMEHFDPECLASEFLVPPSFDTESDDFTPTPEALAAARRAALFCFHRTMVVDRWKLDPAKLYLFVVRTGDVAPDLKPGYWALCDGRERYPRRDGIYAIARDEHIVFRRAVFLDQDTVRLTWKDAESGPDSAETAVHEINLVGRVVWFGARIGRS